MMRLIQVRRYFSEMSKTASFASAMQGHTIRENKLNKQSLEKLDLLGQVIMSLTNFQMDYLKLQIAQKTIKSNPQSLLYSNIYSLNQKKDPQQLKWKLTQYFYQQQWIESTWKQSHVLTALISPDTEKDATLEKQEVVKEIYDFELTSVDPAQKIKVIKVLRELLNLGLKEAKDFVDKAPIVFKKGKKEQGETLKTQLAAAGCVVTLK